MTVCPYHVYVKTNSAVIEYVFSLVMSPFGFFLSFTLSVIHMYVIGALGIRPKAISMHLCKHDTPKTLRGL